MTLSEEEIQKIIEDEIQVDAYSETEINMGWEIFMDEQLSYPFEADYMIKFADGRKENTKIEVIKGLDNQSNNIPNYLVEAIYNGLIIQVKLSDLNNIESNEDTKKAIAVWRYEFIHNH